MSTSLIERIAALPEPERTQALKAIPPERREAWRLWARDEQLPPPGLWRFWLMMAGRRAGKTRSAAEWLAERVDTQPGYYFAAGETFGHTRDVLVEAPDAGLLAAMRRRHIAFDYNRSLYEIAVPRTGAHVKLVSGDEPERVRGYGFHGGWMDELAAWTRHETFDMLNFAASEGDDVRIVITTTPRPRQLLRDLLNGNVGGGVATTRMSIFDNEANLAPGVIAAFREAYDGTTLGRQELYGELIEPVGALFRAEWFPLVPEPAPAMAPRVRAWDLAATEESPASPNPDWTAGVRMAMRPGGALVVEDVVRVRRGPGEVERLLRATADGDGPGTHILIEQEPGSAGKAHAEHLRSNVLYGCATTLVRPTGSKGVRARLVAGLAEQGKVELLRADWNRPLLDELTAFDPDSPAKNQDHDDQADALSYAAAWLTQSAAAPAGTAAGAQRTVRIG